MGTIGDSNDGDAQAGENFLTRPGLHSERYKGRTLLRRAQSVHPAAFGRHAGARGLFHAIPDVAAVSVLEVGVPLMLKVAPVA